MAPRQTYDIAIVGGGIAGLYCAFRLADACRGKRMAVFEAGDRFGGRLYSVRCEHFAYPAEMGALSFSDAHENVSGLAEALGLVRSTLDVHAAHYYLRGVRSSSESFKAAVASSYRLPPAEQGGHPRTLLIAALLTLAPGLTSMWPLDRSVGYACAPATAAHLRALELFGLPLWRWSWWNLLSLVLSNEAYELIRATIGSSASMRNQNAYDAIWTLLWETREQGRHYRFRDGFQQLAEALMQAGTHSVYLDGRRLVSVAGASGAIELSFDTAAGEERVLCERVILALPQPALKRLRVDADTVGDQFHTDLDAVQPVAACKLFLAGCTAQSATCAAPSQGAIAACFTDLPLQQCYWPGDAEGGERALLMASFADDAGAAFWSELAGQDTAPDGCVSAPKAVIGAALGQLRAVFGEDRLAQPVEGWFVDWSRPPFEAAWHAWRAGAQSWRVRERMARPTPQARLFVCGEAFAQTQGWTEGAINNAEMMLERHFGVARPAWVRADYPFEF